MKKFTNFENLSFKKLHSEAVLILGEVLDVN